MYRFNNEITPIDIRFPTARYSTANLYTVKLFKIFLPHTQHAFTYAYVIQFNLIVRGDFPYRVQHTFSRWIYTCISYSCARTRPLPLYVTCQLS